MAHRPCAHCCLLLPRSVTALDPMYEASGAELPRWSFHPLKIMSFSLSHLKFDPLAVKPLRRPDAPHGLAPVKIDHASRIKIAAFECVQQRPVSRPDHLPRGQISHADSRRQRLSVHVGVNVPEVCDVVSETRFKVP